MWIVVYLAKGIHSVSKIKKIMQDNKIMVMVVKKTDDSEDKAFYEMLVPQTEVLEAQNLIIGA